jgi:hypothetical protein
MISKRIDHFEIVTDQSEVLHRGAGVRGEDRKAHHDREHLRRRRESRWTKGISVGFGEIVSL